MPETDPILIDLYAQLTDIRAGIRENQEANSTTGSVADLSVTRQTDPELRTQMGRVITAIWMRRYELGRIPINPIWGSTVRSTNRKPDFYSDLP